MLLHRAANTAEILSFVVIVAVLDLIDWPQVVALGRELQGPPAQVNRSRLHRSCIRRVNESGPRPRHPPQPCAPVRPLGRGRRFLHRARRCPPAGERQTGGVCSCAETPSLRKGDAESIPCLLIGAVTVSLPEVG